MKKYTLIIFLCLFANSYVYANNWTGPVTIVDIYTWNSSYVNIRVSPYRNLENCPDTQGYQLVSSTESTWFNRMYSQILAAYTSGKQISFLLDGCGGTKAIIKAISYTQPMTP